MLKHSKIKTNRHFRQLDNTAETPIFMPTILRKTLFRIEMKKGIHPEYKPVVFQDASCDFAILTRSTIKTNDTIKWSDGKQP